MVRHFNIRTSDEWWRDCIDLLMESAQLIVMDVSRVSEGSSWEITRLAARNLLHKCVFVAQDGFEEEGRATLRRLLPDGDEPTLHVFNSRGRFDDAQAFRHCLGIRVGEGVGRPLITTAWHSDT